MGTGMKHPRQPRVIIGNMENGYVQGDLADINAIMELIEESKGESSVDISSISKSIEEEMSVRKSTDDEIKSDIELVKEAAAEERYNRAQAIAELRNLIELVKVEVGEQTASVEGYRLIINF